MHSSWLDLFWPALSDMIYVFVGLIYFYGMDFQYHITRPGKNIIYFLCFPSYKYQGKEMSDHFSNLSFLIKVNCS